jgi:hypothetical protein
MILARIENHTDLLTRFICSEQATFHLNSKVNRHNFLFYGMESSHFTLKHERDLPEVNVFCAISKWRVYGPFFFMEDTIVGNLYLDLLTLWLLAHLEEDSNNFIC